MLLEDIMTKEEYLTLNDFEYITRPKHTEDDKRCVKTIDVYINEIMPEFNEEAKNKIDYLRPLVEDGDFKAIENIYRRSMDYFLVKNPSIAQFNVIFVQMLCKASGSFD